LAELGIAGRVINMQDYFQRLLPNQTETAELIKQLFSTNNLNQQGLKGFKAQKLRLEVQLQGQLINYVTYFDRWGLQIVVIFITEIRLVIQSFMMMVVN
jgi:poly(glycerol-phosphate) alpha-glucosyltransferase